MSTFIMARPASTLTREVGMKDTKAMAKEPTTPKAAKVRPFQKEAA